MTRLWLSTLALCFAAHSALAHGDLHEQIAALTARIRKDPQNAALYHKRGELQRAHAAYVSALADYDTAERLDPKLDVVHLSRGRTLLEARRPEPAQRELTRFLEKHPDHSEALLHRARAGSLLGKRLEADADFARAIAASADPILDLFVERAANLTAAGDHPAALTVLTGAIDRLGPLAVLQEAALEAELALHRTAAALQRLDIMLTAAPRKEVLLERKARVLLAAGRAEEARATFLAAMQEIDALPERQRKLRATAKLQAAIRIQLGQTPPAPAP